MKTLGFVNQKGGVGKSFVSKIVANALSGSQHKKRVLLIDCDDEQTISADLRQRDFRYSNEFRYDVAICSPTDLPAVIAGRKPLHVVTKSGFENLEFDEKNYDYTIIDMPGRGQDKGISGLLACLDFAIIVVKGDDSESLSTLKFLKKITETKELRQKHEIRGLHHIGIYIIHLRHILRHSSKRH